MSSWNVLLALLLTVLVPILLRFSSNPKIQHADRVAVDFCLGFVAVGASVFWLRILALAWG